MIQPYSQDEAINSLGRSAHPTLRDAERLVQPPHGTPPLARTHQFFWATSWSIYLSNSSSATSFFSRLFSASSSLRRLTSSALRPPYWLRQRWKVCSLIASFWQTCPMAALWASCVSASRSLSATCSGLCRFPLRVSFAPHGAAETLIPHGPVFGEQTNRRPPPATGPRPP